MNYPSITQLEYFVAVAHCGNYSAAARSIPVTRQAVAKGITDLESILQVELFTTEGKKKTLTPAGAELLPYAERIIDDNQSIIGLRNSLEAR